MQRRAFLLATGALGGFAASPPGIIDTHIHFYDPSRPQGVPWPAKSETLLYRTVLPADLDKLTRKLGVTGVVVVEASPWLEDNQWVLDLAKDSPLILALIGNLPCGTPEFAKHLDRFRKNPLFRGIRLNGKRIGEGLSNPLFMKDIHRMADAGLTLDAIGGEAMLTEVARLNDAVPSLKIVLDHLPFDAPATPALRDLGRRPQIYAKVSNVGPKTQRAWLDELWAIFGADRLVYGSNWPVSERVAPYDVSLKMTQDYFAAKGGDAASKFFRANSRQAYGWPLPRSARQ